MSEFRKELETAINRCSMENGSNTPDFILAEFLTRCLHAFDQSVTRREQWYGRDPAVGPASRRNDGPQEIVGPPERPMRSHLGLGET